jgi:hypothetical protein
MVKGRNVETSNPQADWVKRDVALFTISGSEVYTYWKSRKVG